MTTSNTKGIRFSGSRTRSTLARTAFAAAIVLLLAQIGGDAAPVPGDLPFTKSFTVTGDYVVGGVDLKEDAQPPDVNGMSTGEIVMSGVPADADIVAAYLFWETITTTAELSAVPPLPSLTGVKAVKFRGTPIDVNNPVFVKRSSSPTLTIQNSPCFGNQLPLTTHQFRADVLSLLPMRVDADGKMTGHRLVNSADLGTYGPHTVSLPVSIGNAIPESAGASLVVVYRVPTTASGVPAAPLRKVVIYSGNAQMALTDSLERSLQGFYEFASTPSAKVTYLIAAGQPNNNEKITFNGQEIASDFFPSGSASQRSWAPTTTVNTTFSLTTSQATSGSSIEPDFGRTVQTRIFHEPINGGEDCLTWAGVVFSAAVADIDHDGLPDGLEDASGGLKDPDGTNLPNLNQMGGSSTHPDVFVEFNAMWAAAGTSYGSLQHPLSPTQPIKTDLVGHNHMPTPEVLKKIADAYVARGITPHFDVGSISAYHAPNNPYDPKKFGVIQHTDWVDDYTSTEADPYLVPTAYARGGEVVKEVACVPSPTVICQFPAYPGTVRWKGGLIINRDGPVDDAGEELATDDIDEWADGGSCGSGTCATQRRRFDPARRGLFHYVFNAHTRAKPKSPDPCLINGVPGPYPPNQTTCTGTGVTDNPEFHVPLSVSGIGDLPGGNLLTTLGLWTDFVAKPFARASTIFHELGHNGELYHGGLPPIWGNSAAIPPTSTYVEPNCKPNYLSSMSYLFQIHGLFDNNDEIHLDYSGTAHTEIDETSTLSDAPLSPAALYQPAWFAPANSLLASNLGVSPAKRFCSGAIAPPIMARVYTPSVIDWNGDTVENSVPSQDVNFDNTLSGPPRQLNGFDDWAGLRLDQIGASRDVGTGFLDLSGGGVLELAEGGVLELAEGGLMELSEGGVLELAEGGVLELAEGGLLELSEGGVLELAEGGVLELAEGQPEMPDTLAKGLAIGRPHGLTACVIGRDAGCATAPPSDPLYHRVQLKFNACDPCDNTTYHAQRKRAGANDNTYVTVGTSPTNRITDMTQLADGVQYEYRARAETPEGNSAWAKLSAPITATNEAPVAVAGPNYQVITKQTLNVAAPGVVGNDTDVDSPQSFIKAVLVTGPANAAQFSLNANGSFSYKPKNGFIGIDTFTYKANNGVSSDTPTVPLSGDSATVTVQIEVFKK